MLYALLIQQNIRIHLNNFFWDPPTRAQCYIWRHPTYIKIEPFGDLFAPNNSKTKTFLHISNIFEAVTTNEYCSLLCHLLKILTEADKDNLYRE
jgi:hypothetical protein